MRKNENDPRPNYLRRTFGALLCLSPLGIASVSLGWGMVHLHTAHLFVIGVSLGLMTLAVLVSAMNFYLSFIRPARFQHKPDYHFVSGIPMVGSLLVTAGSLIGFGSVIQAMVGIVALLIDTGGSVWFLIATWRDTGFWDA